MKIVGVENIIADYYWHKDNVYFNGGGTVSNILLYLNHFGIPSKIIGYVGNDSQGKWINNSLEKLRIDTSAIVTVNQETKSFYIKDKKTTSVCPLCQKKKKRYPNISLEMVKKSLQKEDCLILKDYSALNAKILESVSNKVYIDIGCIKPFLYLENVKILSFFQNKIHMLSIKEEVLVFLLKKLQMKKEELLSKINANRMIITKGKNGASFILNKQEYIFLSKEPFAEIETNGCGDAFFSVLIYHDLNGNYQKENFESIFDEVQILVETVISRIGARDHIIKNVKVPNGKECVCKMKILSS